MNWRWLGGWALVILLASYLFSPLESQKRQMAQCMVEGIRTFKEDGVDQDKRDWYVKLCMQATGFEINESDAFCQNVHAAAAILWRCYRPMNPAARWMTGAEIAVGLGG